MHYKIYFENKPLFLLDAIDEELKPHLSKDNILFVNELSAASMLRALQSIRSAQTDAVLFFHNPLEELKAAFWNEFTLVQAAGGLIANELNQVLCIFRRGKWDLPKGKLDAGETLEQCAVREVQEETGLSVSQLQDLLLVTYHTYRQDGEDILKETYWYRMRAGSTASLQPQLSEQIEEVRWVDPKDFPTIILNTYQAINDVLNKYTKE